MIQGNSIHHDEEWLVGINKQWKDGEGHLEGDIWYGLKSTHCLTQNYLWKMKIVFQLKNDEWHTTILAIGLHLISSMR